MPTRPVPVSLSMMVRTVRSPRPGLLGNGAEAGLGLAQLTDILDLGIAGLERTAKAPWNDDAVVVANKLVPIPSQLLVVIEQL